MAHAKLNNALGKKQTCHEVSMIIHNAVDWFNIMVVHYTVERFIEYNGYTLYCGLVSRL